MRNRNLRFHLLGLSHLPVSERYMACAFTQKIVKLSKMLTDLGHEVFLYGSEGSDAICTTFIQTHTLEDIRTAWGEGDDRFEIGYDWHKKQFKHDINEDHKTEATQRYMAMAIEHILKQKREDDFLLITQGYEQKPIADAAGLYLTCEPGVGYRGSFTHFKAFESAALQNFTYGSQHPFKCINGNFYDRVIPNYYDMKDFPTIDEIFNTKREDYLLFIGRLIERKGIMIAVKTAAALDYPLKIVGQGDPEPFLIEAKKMFPNYHKLSYLPTVGSKDRAVLMMKARAVLVPTIYLEAFGGVNVEAQLCGTPVITTNFGVFPETVVHGKTGFLCNTLLDFVQAAEICIKAKRTLLDPLDIQHRAQFLYSMDQVAMEYQSWFQDLYQLYLSSKDNALKGWHWLPQSYDRQNLNPSQSV